MYSYAHVYQCQLHNFLYVTCIIHILMKINLILGCGNFCLIEIRVNGNFGNETIEAAKVNENMKYIENIFELN